MTYRSDMKKKTKVKYTKEKPSAGTAETVIYKSDDARLESIESQLEVMRKKADLQLNQHKGIVESIATSRENAIKDFAALNDLESKYNKLSVLVGALEIHYKEFGAYRESLTEIVNHLHKDIHDAAFNTNEKIENKDRMFTNLIHEQDRRRSELSEVCDIDRKTLSIVVKALDHTQNYLKRSFWKRVFGRRLK